MRRLESTDGGLKGAVGVAEDRAEASIACRQTGPIVFSKPLGLKEEVLTERESALFKKLRVVRMVDKPPRNTLVYLSYSDRVIDGYPQNSVTALLWIAAPPSRLADDAVVIFNESRRQT